MANIVVPPKLSSVLSLFCFPGVGPSWMSKSPDILNGVARPLLTGVAFGVLRDRLLRKTGEEGVVGREDEPEGGSSWSMLQKEDNDAH